MQISRNSIKNRFNIEDISEPNSKKTGISGYHGGLWCVIGWIAAKIFNKAVRIKTDKGVYYLNCKSLENWYKRVAPGSIAENDKDFSKKMHDPKAVKIMIESLKKPSKAHTPQDLWKKLETSTNLLPIAYLEDNEDHRFEDVKCPKNTAIIVENHSLHANRMTEGIATRFDLIASQAPLQGNEALFWQWIFENEYSILDLTTLADQDNGVTKYYPEAIDETFQAGPYFIKLIEKEGLLRKYQITFENETKEFPRFHLTRWQDFSEGSLEILTELVKIVEKNPKMLIHCRAGIGRTGTLITAVLLKEKIEKGEITKENFDESLNNLILSLREKRGPGFVQTCAQFEMLRHYGRSIL